METSLEPSANGAHGFDFLHGTWTIRSRRLRSRLTNSEDWDEGPGQSSCWPLFGGAANIDELAFPTYGFSGVTLRLYDPARHEWSLYWANSRDGILQPPVVGRFVDGRGDFYGNDTEGRVPIVVHFIWSEITPTSARWEQEFSTDEGKTWETNWIMDLSRDSVATERPDRRAADNR